MANEDKKEELKLNQLLVTSQREVTTAIEEGLGVSRTKQLVNKEILDVSRQLADAAAEELAFQEESTNSLRSESELLAAQAKVKALNAKNQQQILDLQTKGGENLTGLISSEKERLKALIAQAATGDDIAASVETQIEGRDKLNKQLLLADDFLRAAAKVPFVGAFIDAEKVLKKMEKTTLKTGNGFKGIMVGVGEGLKMLGKASPFILLKYAIKALKFIIDLAFKLSTLMTKVQTTTGLSAEKSKEMFRGMQATAKATGKVYITSEKIAEAFTEMTEQTGMIANFGGDFLETVSTLKDRLKMSAEESSQLAYFTRLQGKDGDKVLSTQVKLVNQYNKQNNLLITAKGVFQQISKASGTVAVSLGNSLDNLTKAALAATKLGLSMDEIHGAAGGFLDFQTSIQKELEFSLATNQQVSFAKERELALANDLAGLAEALTNKEEVLLAFRTGNRIQMDLAAGAMNMTSDQLAKIIRQEDYRKMVLEGTKASQAEFAEMYGEQSLASMLELDAQEKIAATIANMRDKLLEVGETLLPIIEYFTEMVSQAGFIESAVKAITVTTNALFYATGAVVGMKIAQAIATAFASSMRYGPLVGGALGLGAVALIKSQVKAPPAKAIPVEDAAISGIKINTLPMDSIQIDKGGNKISVGTDLNGNNNMDAVVKELKKVRDAVNSAANLHVGIQYDGFKAENVKASGGNKVTNTKYKSSFD